VKAWLKSTVGVWGWAATALLLPGLALASVGKVSALEGTAKRTNGEEVKALEVGSEIEVNDTIDVGPASNLKLTLTDESVIMLAERSQLIIDEATFEGQDRKGFAARLGFGKVWAKVKKALAGSDSKFEVQTDRAVAGVRGTIFRVDYVHDTAKAIMPAAKLRMMVRVVEGRVVVSRLVRKAVEGQTPASQDPKPGERKQVAAPQVVSLDEWEKKFVELQGKQEIEVGNELGKPGPLNTKAMKDAFGRFVDRNQ